MAKISGKRRISEGTYAQYNYLNIICNLRTYNTIQISNVRAINVKLAKRFPSQDHLPNDQHNQEIIHFEVTTIPSTSKFFLCPLPKSFSLFVILDEFTEIVG